MPFWFMGTHPVKATVCGVEAFSHLSA